MTDDMDRSDRLPAGGADRRESFPAPAPAAEAEHEKREMTAAQLSRLEEQRPVSVTGWLLAFAIGAAIWALIFGWFLN